MRDEHGDCTAFGAPMFDLYRLPECLAAEEAAQE